MKKLVFTILGVISIISCQKDDIKSTTVDKSSMQTFKTAWKEAKLDLAISKKQGYVNCYLFSKDALSSIQSFEQLHHFRFVLGLTEGQLDIKTEGVNSKGVSLGSISSIRYSDNNIANQISKMSSAKNKFATNDIILKKHLLEPNLAFKYIQEWQNKATEKTKLNDIVSYDGVRINYFSIEKEVIAAISKSSNFQYLAVLLGVNPEGKLTTVLLGLDSDKTFSFSTSSSKNSLDSGAIYDFTRPCPSACDPESSLN